MRTSLIAIGNSRGLRIPKALLASTGMVGEVDMEARGTEIIIRAANPRRDWDQAFAAAGVEPGLIWPDTRNEWDNQEWEW